MSKKPKLSLAEALQRTKAPEVSVKFSQVAEAIGEDKATELAEGGSTNGLTQKVTRRRQKPKLYGDNLITVNRLDLVEALEGKDEDDQDEEGTSFSSF